MPQTIYKNRTRILTLPTNKILPEPDISNIFLWSLAVSLQTAMHM